MENIIINFQKLLNEGDIKISNQRLKKVIQNYTFLYISQSSEFAQNKLLIQKIIESKVIIVNQYTENESNVKYFIISFKNTLIFMEQSSITILENFFSSNTDLLIYFLSNTRSIFNDIKNTYFECDSNFQIEISNFHEKFKIIQKQGNLYRKLCYVIQSSITGYLIQQSYFKLNQKQNINFSHHNLNKDNVKQLDYWNEDEYIELRKIGQGTSFLVELIYHIEKEKLFVIKKPNYSIEQSKLIERYVDNFTLFNYPFLTKLYGKVKIKEYLIFQFIDGFTLQNIGKMNLAVNDKITIIFEIMMIIKYFHNKQFIIRDLKPDNIIINHKKVAYFIDFDRIIKYSDISLNNDLTCDFSSVYAAPEINTKFISFKSDIYSLGQIIYYIMNEKNPEISDQNILKQLSLFEYNVFQDIYIKCTDENKENRPNIQYLIFSYYNFFYSFINREVFIDEELLFELFLFTNEFNFYYYSNGLEYLDEERVKKDVNRAIYCFNIVVKSKNEYTSISLNILGDIYYLKEKYNKFDIKKAIYYYEQAANNNFSESQFNLGLIYYKGKYVKKDITKAINYFILSSNQNNPNAQVRLELIYLKGKYIKRDINKAIKYFSLAADQNCFEGLINLGNIYYYGVCSKCDMNKAIHYYSIAAKQNNSSAQFNLGLVYMNNTYSTYDIDKAIHYFSLAANKNCLRAQFKLGEIYFCEKYLRFDINKAIHYFSLAANQNHTEAQTVLGTIYYDKTFSKYDIDKAIHYFSIVANQNNLIAQMRLGEIYFDEKYSRFDINKSIHYFLLAANQNNSMAQYNLGLFYYNGEKIKQDMNKAIHYLSLAANNNYAEAQYILGVIYYHDKYINIKKALYYLSLAANQNHASAQLYLGRFYIKKDINKALYFLENSAKQNQLHAKFLLGIIFYGGIYVKRDISKALTNLLDCANQNFSSAQFILGCIYYKGNVTPKDVDKAIHYFEISANQNCVDSLSYLGHIYYDEEHKKNIEKSIHYHLLAANHNHPLSQCYLGYIYHERKNLEKSIFYYSLSTNQNNSIALNNIAIIYLYHKRDIVKGIRYLSLAAKLNSYHSQYLLGWYYINGIFVHKNNNIGIDLINEACKNGDIRAHFDLGYFYLEGKYISRNIKKSMHHFHEASNFKINGAKNNIGIIYKNGINNEIKPNIEYSIIYFIEAIQEEKDALSMYNLANIYIYNDKYKTKEKINESIELLIKSCNQKCYQSIFLLTIALIIKHGHDLEMMKQEIFNLSDEKLFLFYYMCSIINKYQLFDESLFLQNYNFYKNIDYLYSFRKEVIESYKILTPTNQLIDITAEFYEGFNIDV